MFKKFMILTATSFAFFATPAQAGPIAPANPAPIALDGAGVSGLLKVQSRPRRRGPNHGSRRHHCHRDAFNHRGYRRLHRHKGRRCEVKNLRPRYNKRFRDRRDERTCVRIGPITFCE